MAHGLRHNHSCIKLLCVLTSVQLPPKPALEEGLAVAVGDHIGPNPVAEFEHFVGAVHPLEFNFEKVAQFEYFVALGVHLVFFLELLVLF